MGAFFIYIPSTDINKTHSNEKYKDFYGKNKKSATSFVICSSNASNDFLDQNAKVGSNGLERIRLTKEK